MSRDTVTGVAGHRCISGSSGVWSWRLAQWLVVAVGVEREFAEECAGVGLDDAEVAVGDEGEDSFVVVGAAQSDVAESAVSAQGDHAAGVDLVAAHAVVDRDGGLGRPGVAARSGWWRPAGRPASRDIRVGPELQSVWRRRPATRRVTLPSLVDLVAAGAVRVSGRPRAGRGSSSRGSDSGPARPASGHIGRLTQQPNPVVDLQAG